MRLFVLGATGRTGREVLDLARARGHEITAFVRSPQKLAPADHVRVVAGDPLSTEGLRAALPGHDAVLSALGPPSSEAFRAHTLLTDCAASTVAAMTTAGVARLGVVSAALLFPDPRVVFRLFQRVLGHHVRDLRTMEAIVTASDLAWTIARPPRLVQAHDAGYDAERDALPGGRFTASFRGVAAFLLDAVERGSHVGEIVGVVRGRARE